MGKKKGKQAGEFDYKSQNALHRHTVYVDRASEANKYRNPVQIGRGHGYRIAYHDNNNINCNTTGYWHSNGSAYGGGDKWSSIFSSNRSNNNTTTRSTQTSSTSNVVSSSNNRSSSINANLSRLRHLLEERRSEDRMHDREHRLRLQRSRMLVESYNYDIAKKNTRKKQHNSDEEEDRHEPGWLLSYDMGKNLTQQKQKDDTNCTNANSMPSLQQLASKTLGPLLPMYCAAIGSDFVSESLKSVSADILSQLSISLATSSDCWSSDKRNNDNMIATTDGTVKALVHSGVATSLVLRGAPIPSLSDMDMNDDTIQNEEEEDDDTKWLSDNGLLALCPRILSTNNAEADEDNERSDEDDDSSREHWESIDFDLDLNSRMTGCFHLQRLELIDIPLRQFHDDGVSSSHSSRGGISIHVLRSVLRACSNITHLSLSGCFYNWESECLSTTTVEETDNISTFLCGKQSIKELANSFMLFGKAKHLDKAAMHLLPQLLFRQMFEEENVDHQSSDIVVGLDELLPELRVLDISHCNWVTPEMIIQFLLKLWGNAIMSSTDEVDTSSTRCESEWNEKDYKHHLLDAFNSIHLTNSDVKKQCAANVSLVHLNIRGSTNLISESSSWLEGWRKHGLFDGIDVSTDRHVRR